ncbi:hypothetical protein [Bradyrhizobium sp. HKCCYLRH3061]|uniref:hypothetical protein n=1 Tax=Bradyrhizobium sp. HKCCYLRH3061 TaxID=3420734 RepID=UPI003EBFD423
MTGTDEPLKPEDFPLEADKERVQRQDGKPIATTKNEAMAHEIAERLNPRSNAAKRTSGRRDRRQRAHELPCETASRAM